MTPLNEVLNASRGEMMVFYESHWQELGGDAASKAAALREVNEGLIPAVIDRHAHENDPQSDLLFSVAARKLLDEFLAQKGV